MPAKFSLGIIGGGITGMYLSHRLAKKGYQVTLFEASPQLGGLVDSWSLGNIVWDRYYHVTSLTNKHLHLLLSELGMKKEIKWIESYTGFFVDGQLYSMSNIKEFLSFPPLNLWNKMRLGLNVFYASKINNWENLEKILAVDWLKQWSGKATLEKIWKPLLKSKLGEDYDKVSAAFIWGMISLMYSARRTGLKKEMFGYVPGGYARILKRFTELLLEEGVTVKTSYLASEIKKIPSNKISVSFQNYEKEIFDRVILTTPSEIAAQITPDLTKNEKTRLTGTRYIGVVCASLLLKKSISKFYVTNITDTSIPFTAVIEMSALVDRNHFDGNALVYLPKYVQKDDPFFSLSDNDIEDIFLDALKKMYPQFRDDDLVYFRVSKDPYVSALSTLNYSQQLLPINTSIPGIHIVNSARVVNGALTVDRTLQQAEAALSNIFSDGL